MKKLILILLVVFIFLPAGAFCDYSQNVWLKEYQKGVVAIIAKYDNGSGALGSGFLVTEDGYIVTNKHVVADAVKIDIYTKDLNRYGARLVGYHSVVDIAVIKIEPYEPLKYFTEKDVANEHMVFVGDTVYAIGHPRGMIWTVTKGIITSDDRIDDKGTQYYQIDAAINYGNSGGLLINEAGKIVGVPTLAIPPFAAEDMAFAIKVKVFVDEVKMLIIEDRKRLTVIKNIHEYKKNKGRKPEKKEKRQIIIQFPEE